MCVDSKVTSFHFKTESEKYHKSIIKKKSVSLILSSHKFAYSTFPLK